MAKSWTPSGLYKGTTDAARRLAEQGADWWRNRGYEVNVRKVAGGWKHYRMEK